MQKFSITYSDIDWGEDEAKNDDALQNYFVEFPGYEKILEGKKRYIVGRKGTGKSAILKKIRLDSIADPLSFHTDISLRDFPLNDFKGMGDRSLQDKSKYVSAWKFLLLTEVANLYLQDNSICEDEKLQAIKKIISDNFPNGTSIGATIRQLRQRENKISISPSILAGEYDRTNAEEVTAQIHFNKAVKAIENLLAGIQTKSTFIVLIDELDEGYKSGDSNINLIILSLLRATDEIFYFFKDIGVKCLPILVLRSDIFDSLEDNDLNKLDDYVLRLNWTTSVNDPWSLKKIVEERIAATVREKYPTLKFENYWKLIADEECTPKGLFQYLCILTFSRPRDIIKLLKYCADTVSGPKLTLSDVRRSEIAYSAWFYREFRDEAQSFLPCWKEALNCISEIAEGKEKIETLTERLSANDRIRAWCSECGKEPIDIVRVLFDYSVIGCINDKGRWIFKYKDDFFEFMLSYPYYCVHYGLCRKLRIPRSYDSSIIEAYRSYN